MDTIDDFKEKFFSDFDFSNQSKYLRKPKKEELADGKYIFNLVGGV